MLGWPLSEASRDVSTCGEGGGELLLLILVRWFHLTLIQFRDVREISCRRCFDHKSHCVWSPGWFFDDVLYLQAVYISDCLERKHSVSLLLSLLLTLLLLLLPMAAIVWQHRAGIFLLIRHFEVSNGRIALILLKIVASLAPHVAALGRVELF